MADTAAAAEAATRIDRTARAPKSVQIDGLAQWSAFGVNLDHIRDAADR